MASFTGVGDSVELFVKDSGEDVSIAISGTYSMDIRLQKEQGSKGSGSWADVAGFRYNTANATVAAVYKTQSFNENLRLFVVEDTSGTATATLAEGSKDIEVRKDRVGNTLFTQTDLGRAYEKGLKAGDAVETGGSDLTLTVEEHAGRTIVFNSAAGDTVTLPAATGSGAVFYFAVGVTVTSNDDIIQVANATDEFVGNLFQIDTDTSDAIAAYPCLDGDGFDTVTLNGSTKGGLMGDFITVVDVDDGKFAISGTVLGTGTVVTPLSAAVS